MAKEKVKFKSELGERIKWKVPAREKSQQDWIKKMKRKRILAKGKIFKVFFLSPVIPSTKLSKLSKIHSQKF
jgi:hypothetical protein